MNFEIVFPNNNEHEFVKIADALDIKKIVFIYDEKHYKDADTKINKIETNIELEKGILVKNTNQKYNSKFVVAKSSLNDRSLIESKSANLIFGFESVHSRDSTHQRNSNLNHITCTMAQEKNISFGFSYSSILESQNKPLIIGRMIQNLKLCRKYQVKPVFASFTNHPYNLRSKYDIDALFRTLNKN